MFLPEEFQGRGAWWAAVYEVAQSQTWLKWLSSSSSKQRTNGFKESVLLRGSFFANSSIDLSVQFSCSVVSDSLRTHESQHARPPCPSQTPKVHSDSRPSSWWCHPAISSSVVPFSSCPQSLSASGSFPMSQLFAWGGQSTGVSALASVLPMNTQDWSSLEWTGWISLQSKGLSRVFSNTTVQKYQFFNMLSRLVITFLPRSKRLLISWLQSQSAVILEPPK